MSVSGIWHRAWRHLGSSIVFLIGFLAIIWGLSTVTRPAGQYSDTLLAGVVMVFGALAYKSAKKRWLGEAKSTMTRQLLEIALLVVVCVAVLAQPNLKHLMVTDPIPNVVIPTWAIVAYLVIALKPRVGEHDDPPQHARKWCAFADMVEETTSRLGGLRDDNNGIANVDIDRTKSYRCR